jgi:hypothetical protein
MSTLVKYDLDAIIASGASLSGELILGEGRAAAIIMPAAWTAAGLTFQVSTGDGTFVDLYDAAGTEYTVAAAASRAVLLPIADFLGFSRLRIRSGTSGAPVNQGDARTLKLVMVG